MRVREWVSAHASDLGVDVEDAGAAGVHHLMDGVDPGAVQVPVVLSVLQVLAVLDVCLHL